MVLTDLPPKMFRDAELDLSPEQRATLRDGRERRRACSSTSMGDEITIQHVFELVLRLKQICNFDPATGASSKLERLEADLEEVAASGKKAIVFSQWVKCLRDPRAISSRRFGPLEYHGQSPVASSATACSSSSRRTSRKHVILMSYGAGSVGLNLQFCEYVFLFDRWWNPAVEDQAINRAHRIGAAGPVTVTRMLTPGHDRRADQPGAGAQARAVRPDHRAELRRRPRWASRKARSSACSTCARPRARSSRRRRGYEPRPLQNWHQQPAAGCKRRPDENQRVERGVGAAQPNRELLVPLAAEIDAGRVARVADGHQEGEHRPGAFERADAGAKVELDQRRRLIGKAEHKAGHDGRPGVVQQPIDQDRENAADDRAVHQPARLATAGNT